MTYEETLAALQEMIGEHVLVAVSPTDGDPQPRIAMAGVLRRGEASPGMDVMQRLGRASPDDEGLLFHVGGADSPAEKNYFSLTKGGFVEAERVVGPFGESFLTIQSGGLRLNIVTKQEAERALGPPPG